VFNLQISWRNLDFVMESAQPNSDTPKPCAGGCGFFGSAPLNFYCSVCFKKAHGEEEFKRRVNLSDSAPSTTVAASDTAMNVEDSPTSMSAKMREDINAISISESKADEEGSKSEAVVAAAAVKGEEVLEPAPKKVATNRCFQCNKKVGLTGFGCRCGNTFCSVHRYSDKHDCSFDYKAAGREEIKTANPVVNAEKVARI
jgi:hypothetical protein